MFADLHVRFDSDFDEEIYSYGWTAIDSSSDGVFVRNIRFDYASKLMAVDRGRRDNMTYIIEKADTFAVTDRCQDGLSLFFWARERLHSGKVLSVPCIISEKKARTTIDFLTERESVEIDAVDYPIDTRHFIGSGDFVGFYGLTGSFEGWFSNDERAAGDPRDIVGRNTRLGHCCRANLACSL